MSRNVMLLVAAFRLQGLLTLIRQLKIVLEKKLLKVTRCRVAGSDVSVARAANLHRATEDWTLHAEPVFVLPPESAFSGAYRAADIK